MADGINVGDAVMTFFGDTTKLDQSFAEVQANATKTGVAVESSMGKVGTSATQAAVQVDELGAELIKVPPVPPEVPPSIRRVGNEARQAKAEVGLLGEAIGVQLPRHVRGFLTELPGVASAMNAAFAITAVGFLITALVEVSEKVSEFTASMLYGVEAAKKNMEAQIELNNSLKTLNDQYKAAKQVLDDYGKSAFTLANENLAKAAKAARDATEAVKDNTQALAAAKAEADKLNADQSTITFWQAQKREAVTYWDALKGIASGSLSVSQAIDKMTDTNGAAAPAINKIAVATADLAEAQAKQKVAAEQAQVAARQALDALTAEYVRLDTAERKQDEEWAKQGQAIQAANLAFHNMELAVAKTADSVEELEIKLPPAAAAFLKIGQAMQTVGINTVDLRNEVAKQKEAVDTLYGAYQKGSISLRQFQQAELSEVKAQIALAQAQGQSTAALTKYEAALERSLGLDNQKLRNYQRLTQADKQFMETLKQTGSISQATWEASANAMGSAVAAYAKGSESMGQALASMAQQELASLAERATVKAIEQLALGFGTMFTNPPESGSHFTSAAIWGSIGVASAVAGHALTGAAGGGSGSSGSGASGSAGGVGKANPATASTSQQPTTVINVQRLAGGGMVSAPTLAMVGDSPSGGGQKEAILPLEDGGVMGQLAAAITKAQGGGSGAPMIHVHVQGLISPDNLHKVITQINQRVSSGKSHLTSSNSMRVTKRSQ